MTDQAEPGRPPAHDLAAFDLTKRSPEQLAQSFARWKAQRKRPPEAPPAAEPASRKATVAAGSGSAGDHTAAPKRLRSVQYSDTFSNLLAAGSEPTVQRTERPPIVAARPSPKRSAAPGRQLRAMTVLTGAASVLALAGGALLELSDWRRSPQAGRVVAQAPAPEVPMAGPIVAAALHVPAIEWKLQRTVDLALMKATPTVQMLPEPAAPRIETASKAVASSAQGKSASQPAFKKAAPEAVQFVAKPFVPSAAAAPDAVPAAQRTAAAPALPVAAAIRTGDPRPDALIQHGHDAGKGTFGNGGTSDRVASGGKPASAAGSKSTVDARPVAARTGTATSIDGDPRGENAGGARVGSGSGGGTGAAAGPGDVGGGSDAGGDNTAGNKGGAASDAGSGTGGADTGDNGGAGNDTGGSDTGGSDTGGNDAGGAADGESSASDSENGESDGGAISGAPDGVGEALGGAPGGGESKADNAGKDQRD